MGNWILIHVGNYTRQDSFTQISQDQFGIFVRRMVDGDLSTLVPQLSLSKYSRYLLSLNILGLDSMPDSPH
jgi:hypothetical protein